MNGFIKSIKYFIRKANASKIGAFSAQTAFFMFLSLIPLIMLFMSLAIQLGASSELFSALGNDFTPSAVSAFFELYIDEIVTEEKRSMTIVSAVVLLWSASKGIFSIIGGLNSVYEVKEERNYFLVRFLAMIYTFAFVLILIIALAVMVFGKSLSELICSLLPNLTGLVYIISSLRFILGFLILVLFFSLLYKSLPGKPLRFIEQIPGATVTSAGWVSFSILFSFFVENFSNYANIYGSLTAIIVLLLWLYTCMYIMFIGAEINHILSAKTVAS